MSSAHSETRENERTSEALGLSVGVTFEGAVTLGFSNVTAKCHKRNKPKLNALQTVVTFVTLYSPKKVYRGENKNCILRIVNFSLAYIGLFKFVNVMSLMSQSHKRHNGTSLPLNPSPNSN